MKKLTIFILVFLVFTSAGFTQTEESITNKKVPTLNGHTFPSSSHFGSSFVNTNLQADLGFGLTSTIKIPGIIIEDYEIFSFEGQILFFNTNVTYQQRFTPWLAMYLSF